jgi:hypothetical protein
MAESGGDPNKHNTNRATGDDSYGAWQINMLGDMGPKRLQQFGITDYDQLYNPAINAHAMAVLSGKGSNFNDWSTFKNGSYLKYMGAAVAESKDQSWLSKIGNALDPTKPLDAVEAGVDAIGKTARWVSNSENWVRVGYVVGGGILAIAGLVMIVGNTKAGKALTNVVPAGRAVNTVRTVAKANPPTPSPGGAADTRNG